MWYLRWVLLLPVNHHEWLLELIYHKISNIRRTQPQSFIFSRLILQLSLPNPLKAVPDSRNDPLAISSDPILWSWSADRIPQTPITIGTSDRENTKPNSLLPIESWHTSFTGKFRIKIERSWLNEKCEIDISSWRHNGRRGHVIHECRYENTMANSAQTHSVAQDSTRFGHAIVDMYVYVISVIGNIQTVDKKKKMFQ